MMLGRKPNIYWKACWMIVTPLVIAITIICNCAEYKAPSMDTGEPEAYLYPDWALALGWLITLFPMALIVGFFAFRYCKDGGWLVSLDCFLTPCRLIGIETEMNQKYLLRFNS